MRFFCLAATLLICTFSYGEEPEESKTRYYRHEVNINVGIFGDRSGWSNDYENEVMNRFGLVIGKAGLGDNRSGIIYECQDKPDLCTGILFIGLSYYYHFNHHIAIGGLFGWSSVQDWLGYPEVSKKEEVQKTGFTYLKGTSLLFVPSAKWSWVNNRRCSFYMKASAGFHFQSMYLDSEKIPKEQTDEYKKKHLGFAYYFTPFGWEVGRWRIRWFMEFGIGSHSNFQTGLIYRFGTY